MRENEDAINIHSENENSQQLLLLHKRCSRAGCYILIVELGALPEVPVIG